MADPSDARCDRQRGTMTADRQAVRPSKVPQIIALFWAVKLATTAMGESTSDYLVKRFDPVAAVCVAAVILLMALILQFKATRYVAWRYWFAVVMVAVFGTMAADVLHIQFHIPYVATTTFFATALAVVFVVWHRVEGTLSIHSITTTRRELFYWATVMATFALGTALGDMTATTLHLGYGTSAILFAALMLIPALGYWKFNLNEILAFWTAYVITRPLGASIADWLGKPHAVGGVGLGDGVVSVILAVVIVAQVAYLTLTKADDRDEPTAVERTP